MPPVSSAKAARQAKRAAAASAKGEKKTPASKLRAGTSQDASAATSSASSVNGDDAGSDDGPSMKDADEFVDERIKKLTLQEDEHGVSDRVTTGVLSSLESSRDVKVTSASLVFHGRVLFNDTTIEVNFGRRYGLLGENGCGKSTLLKAIDKREFPFPEHIDIYLLNEGAPPSNLGALEWVIKQAELEMEKMEKMAEDILENDGPDSPLLQDMYDVCMLVSFWIMC
jgi:ATP-binding cassette, subfamily F, member 2